MRAPRRRTTGSSHSERPARGLGWSRLWSSAGWSGWSCSETRMLPLRPPVVMRPGSPIVLVLQLGVGVVQRGAPGVEVVAPAGRRRFQAVPRRVHRLRARRKGAMVRTSGSGERRLARAGGVSTQAAAGGAAGGRTAGVQQHEGSSGPPAWPRPPQHAPSPFPRAHCPAHGGPRVHGRSPAR